MKSLIEILGAAFALCSLGLVGAVTNGAPLSLILPAALCQIATAVCIALARLLARQER